MGDVIMMNRRGKGQGAEDDGEVYIEMTQEEAARWVYYQACVDLQLAHGTCDRGARFKKDRQALINNRGISAATGRKWLIEALRDFATELESFEIEPIDNGENFVSDWEAIKNRLEDIEAIFNPVKILW